MNKKIAVFYFTIEVFAGFLMGILGAQLAIPKTPKYDLNLSILTGFAILFIFALIGIAIPGYFQSLQYGSFKRFLTSIATATVFMIIGIIVGLLISVVTFNYLPYFISSFYIPVLIPILFGVTGFNLKLRE